MNAKTHPQKPETAHTPGPIARSLAAQLGSSIYASAREGTQTKHWLGGIERWMSVGQMRAVNAHAGLVAELKRALSAILTDSDPRYGGEAPRLEQLLASCHEIARSALAKGGGQ